MRLFWEIFKLNFMSRVIRRERLWAIKRHDLCLTNWIYSQYTEGGQR
jgi:hypothetical protein